MTRSPRKILVLALMVAMFAGTGVAAELPAPVDYQVFALPGKISAATEGRLLVPTGTGPYPLAIVSHGWASSSTYMVGWGRMLAELGFVVVVPSFPNPLTPNQRTNKNITKDLVEYYREAPCGSPAHGKVDMTRLIMMSHSAGSVSTVLASDSLEPQVLVFFDPVDTGGDVPREYDDLCVPHMSIYTAGSACNEFGEWSRQNVESEGPSVSFRVKGASHCDGEKPTRVACDLFCTGGSTVARQAEFERYAKAMIFAYIWQEADSWQELTTSALAANDMLLSVVVRDGDACGQVSVASPPENKIDTECEGYTDVPIDMSSTDPNDDGSSVDVDTASSQCDPGMIRIGEDVSGGKCVRVSTPNPSCSVTGVSTRTNWFWLLGLAIISGVVLVRRRRLR